MVRTYDTHLDPADSTYLRARLDELGWRPAVDSEWNLHWSYQVQPLRMFRSLDDSRRICHFPGIGPMVLKEEMYHNLVTARARIGRADRYDYLPLTFGMPDEQSQWHAAMAADPEVTWIRKHKWRDNGYGITMVTDPGDVPVSHEWLVQQYVANPLLLAGEPCRHVIRIFVLITSLDPLVVYLHRHGVVTFTSRAYSTTADALRDPLIHITSAPVQRTNPDQGEPIRAIDLVEYQHRLQASGIDFEPLWGQVRRLAIESVLAHRDPVLQISDAVTQRLDCCFELLGYDLAVDDQLKVWLLEINAGPGIGATTGGGAAEAAQRRAKNGIVHDVLDLIGVAEPGWDVGAHTDRFVAEFERRGEFERIFPAADSGDYLDCLDRVTTTDDELLSSARG